MKQSDKIRVNTRWAKIGVNTRWVELKSWAENNVYSTTKPNIGSVDVRENSVVKFHNKSYIGRK